MDTIEFASIFCQRPQNFAWFLGAGASRTSGLPTATDVIWDLKRRQYCTAENQDISRQDIQSPLVKQRIQEYMGAHGFPSLWAQDEYSTYFEKIFGQDRERQRRYLRAILTEDKVKLSIGSKVMGALLASKFCRAVFTTNFDSIVEKAVAEIAGQSLTAFHIEGSHSAIQALNNEDYPLYCKLHGDFRHDSIKNLSGDLASQNTELSRCFVAASSRFGMVVAGYSGRDASVMELFHEALLAPNPFPNGLYWAELEGSSLPSAVTELLEAAREKGVDAHWLKIDTYDAMMHRLWRNMADRPSDIDKIICSSGYVPVSIPAPKPGTRHPVIRMNALPISSLPTSCFELTFNNTPSSKEIGEALARVSHKIVITSPPRILCWGARSDIENAFPKQNLNIQSIDLPEHPKLSQNTHLKPFYETAVAKALSMDKPLLTRTRWKSSYLIVDSTAKISDVLQPFNKVLGRSSGTIPNLRFTVQHDEVKSIPVTWAECLRITIDERDGRCWLLLEPDIWIWPREARSIARDFISQRRMKRRNRRHNEILDAWIQLIFGTTERNAIIDFQTFKGVNDADTPMFKIARRTGYAKGVGR